MSMIAARASQFAMKKFNYALRARMGTREMASATEAIRATFAALHRRSGVSADVIALFALSTALFFFGAYYFSAAIDSRPGAGMLEKICQFDCIWYGMIAADGYHTEPPAGQQGMANWAFWPVFPMLASLAGFLFGTEFPASGLVLNNVAIFASVLLLYSQRAIFHMDERNAIFACGLIIATPLILYSRVPYSEAVFNFLFLLVIVAWRGDRPLLLAVAGTLFVASRGVGFLLPPILAAALLIQHRGNIHALMRLNFAKVVAISVMPAGFVLYSWHLAQLTGDPLAFTHIHAAWQAGIFENPLEKVYKFFFEYRQRAEVVGIWAIGLSLFLCAVLWRKAPSLRPFVIFFAVSVILCLAITPRSFARYSLAIYLPYLAIPHLIEFAATRRAMIVLFALGQVVILGYWINGAGFLV